MGFIDCIFNQNTEENIVCPDNTVDEPNNTKSADIDKSILVDEITIAIANPRDPNRLTKADVGTVLDTFINLVTNALQNGNSIGLDKFGEFYVKEIPQHIKDGIQIRREKKVIFQPDKSLNDKVNII